MTSPLSVFFLSFFLCRVLEQFSCSSLQEIFPSVQRNKREMHATEASELSGFESGQPGLGWALKYNLGPFSDRKPKA